MTSFGSMRARLTALFLLALASAPPAHAQNVAEFYRGKTVTLYIGFSVGGGYDLYARTLARHMVRHIPGNPPIVPQNMAGAGSLRVANFIYQAAPKDGTAFATMGRGSAFGPLLGQAGPAFDAQKFTWIGSANDEVSVCAAWYTAPFATFDDLRTRTMITGATGPTDETAQIPKVINGVLGTKMRVVTGYPGGNDINLALERGEIEGRCGLSWSSAKVSHQDWIDGKKLKLLVQVAGAKHADLPDVPLATDLASTDEQRQILQIFAARQVMGRPFFAPPDLPRERAAALRAAFMDTMRDPEFLAEAGRAKLEITPVAGEKVEALVREVYRTPAEIALKAGALVGQ
jgi:tripartite-type tricarboxylate transporter receptor subunit TctC